jgi:hypothetical protein
MLSWKEVEEELVEAVRLSWRMPGAGVRASGFATDGPWNLLTRVVRASAGATDRAGADEWAALRFEIEQQQVRDFRNNPGTVPLTAEQVTWMERRLDWLLKVAERDRKLVWLALVQRAGDRRGEGDAGVGRIEWAKVKRWLPVDLGRHALFRRYVRALQGLAKALEQGRQSAAA